MNNPFRYRLYDGIEVETTGADDRIRKVRSFSVDQCYAALGVRDLQKTVENAIHARLRKMLPGSEVK
ncbi:hypothetical protein ACNQFN_18770 [Thauera butanivorans]|uniref:hypothetical protein n=1 Tax=Thauera butanivorans TaxID=86174 RepID=UPI003AB136B3